MATGAPPGSRPLEMADLPARLAAEVVAALRLLPAPGAATTTLTPVSFRFVLAGGGTSGGAVAAPREVSVDLAPDRLAIAETAVAPSRESGHGG